MKIIWVQTFGEDDLKTGESDMVPVDRDYVRVYVYGRPTPSLFHRAFVWPDTEQNRYIYNNYKAARKAWKDSEPNMYTALNSMYRVK